MNEPFAWVQGQGQGDLGLGCIETLVTCWFSLN